jgi:hypothetical protein
MSATLTTTTDQLIDDFLAKVEFEPTPARKRLIFAIDATASRQPTWDLASQVQSQMFLETGRYGGINVRLVYFRGFGEMRATKFFGSAAPLIQAMTGSPAEPVTLSWPRFSVTLPRSTRRLRSLPWS